MGPQRGTGQRRLTRFFYVKKPLLGKKFIPNCGGKFFRGKHLRTTPQINYSANINLRNTMSTISTVIFDLGGVILNLNQDLTLRAFQRLGLDLSQVNFNSHIFTDFETGKISASDFRMGIRSHLKQNISDEAIDTAWNAMLLDLPEHRLKAIEQLRKTHKVYLLSNTNSIHIDAFNSYFKQQYQPERWVQLFDKIYYSYEIGLRKPNTDIYDFVTTDIQIQPEHCLFIDDSLANINGAADAGLKTIHALEPLGEKLWRQLKTALTE